MKKAASPSLRRLTALLLALVLPLAIATPVFAAETQPVAAATASQDEALRAQYLAHTGARLVDVNGDRFCTLTLGKGNDVIFFLPGYGLTAPSVALKPFAAALSEKGFKVIIVEPLGTGMSDIPDTERTIEQITEELHDLVGVMGYSSYSIMAHSIGGAYALYYANQYKAEVRAFISLDSSVPDQVDDVVMSKSEHDYMKNIHDLVVSGQELGEEHYLLPISGYTYTEEERDMLRQMFHRRQMNPASASELAELNNNLVKCKGMKFPIPCEYLGFVSEQNNVLMTPAAAAAETEEELNTVMMENMASYVPSSAMRRVTPQDLAYPNGWASNHVKTYHTDVLANRTYIVPSSHYVHYSEYWPAMVGVIADWYNTYVA